MRQSNFFSILVLWLCIPLCTFAQADRNTIYKVAFGEIEYTPKQEKVSVGSVLGTIGQALAMGSVTTHRDKYAASVRACVLSGLGKVRRFHTIVW